ncbi:uncharacterized protein B0P05DRAFT_561884, partial [Gilbertella persicaria]|uniref:uncharacterized protein n=1 Tax=Gilbertella persicaria TaxID=101096 RepID=UPI00221FADD0
MYIWIIIFLLCGACIYGIRHEMEISKRHNARTIDNMEREVLELRISQIKAHMVSRSSFTHRNNI